MKTLTTLLLALFSLHTVAQEISGNIKDQNKQPVSNAIVLVKQNGATKNSTYTDGNGHYVVKPLAGGKYDLLIVCAGYDSVSVKNIAVAADKPTMRDLTMRMHTADMKQVTIRQEKLKKPLKIKREHEAWKNNRRSAEYSYDKSPSLGVGGATYSAAPPPPSYSQKAIFYNPSEESYKKNPENDFMNVKANPLSTMSVDVDRASYSNVRRFINDGQKPPADAVRVEEMINYFEYDYPQPKGDDPIAIHTELTDCPWQKDHKLLHIGIQAKKVNTDNLPPTNLVFLIDVSGSMYSEDKLPLLVAGMKLLVQNLRGIDKVTIVTYAGAAGMVLPPTSGNNKQTILDALNKLTAGGSTAGGAGIKLAYKVAQENFIKGGNNRVILATDGDFNVGVSSDNELEDLIVKERETGIFLTCLGFGSGNYKDAKMEMLADKGNGNYDYIDNLLEAQKTLVSEFGGTLFTVAKDVKAQIEFNPSKIQAYRIVGYENRLLNEEDFKDDKKDAGDMGAGHTVTIIYELIPVGVKCEFVRQTNDLKYQTPEKTAETYTDELATIKFRYKQPDGNKSKEMTHTITNQTIDWKNATENTRFSESVAMFGMLLKDSKYKGNSNYENVISMADNSKTYDKEGYRSEFVRLVRAAQSNAAKTSAK